MQALPLIQPLRLPNGSVLWNRLAKAAMSEALGTYDNRPMLSRRWASSGLGKIVKGNVMIDQGALGEYGDVVIEEQVRAISTTIKAVDRTGIMAVLWHTGQLKRIAPGKASRPDKIGLSAFTKSALHSGCGAFRMRRLRQRTQVPSVPDQSSSLVSAL